MYEPGAFGYQWRERAPRALLSAARHAPALQPFCNEHALPMRARRRSVRAAPDEEPELQRRSPLISVQPGGKFKYPLQLPMLPFSPTEVMTPGMTKALHLYEPRYLELLEEVLASGHRLFAHVVVEQPVTLASARRPGAYVTGDFAMCMATLVKVLEVRPVQQGALVRIQAEGRLQVLALQQQAPFLKATVAPLHDLAGGQQAQQLGEAIEELKQVMRDVQNLALKFRSEQTANLQAALYWAEGAPVLAGTTGSCDMQELACRLSFAALQNLPQSSPEEQAGVVAHRIAALETLDTGARLAATTEIMSTARGMLAAKVALKSLNLSL